MTSLFNNPKFLHAARKLTPHLLKVRGGRRIVEFFERKSAGAGDIAITDFLGKLTFWCQLDEHMSSHIFWRGSYCSDVIAYLQKHTTPDSVVLDIGANHGEVTLAAASMVPQGAVYAFEPVYTNYRRLLRNLGSNALANVNCFQHGLSDEPGMLPIYSSSAKTDGIANNGIPSLYASDSRGELIQEVRLERLDDFIAEKGIQRVDFIKLDVEGAELAVLKGAVNTLLRFRPTLLVELNNETSNAAGYTSEQLAGHIISRGYRLLKLDPDGSAWPLDVTKIPAFANVVAVSTDSEWGF